MHPQSNSTAMRTQQPRQAQAAQRDSARTAPVLVPPVDIFEDAGGITLLAGEFSEKLVAADPEETAALPGSTGLVVLDTAGAANAQENAA